MTCPAKKNYDFQDISSQFLSLFLSLRGVKYIFLGLDKFAFQCTALHANPKRSFGFFEASVYQRKSRAALVSTFHALQVSK